MPVLNPDHLVQQADRLIASSRRGPPRQADLRRAISNAYYGVFHAVLVAASDESIGKAERDTPRYALVYRSIDHRSLRRLCEAIVKAKMPDKYATCEPVGGFGPDLLALAAAVVELQEKRHTADYDPLFRVEVSDAVSAVSTARTALACFRAANRARLKMFLSLVVFSSR